MQPSPRAPLSQAAKDHVRRGVASGVYEPNSRVSIGELADRFEISPTPVREALVQLVAEGFLRLLPNRGFHVRALTVQEVEDLYPIGAALEDLGLATIPYPGSARIAELHAINARLLRRVGVDPEAMIVINQEWHRRLLADCGNAELQHMMEQLRARTFRYEFICYSFERTELRTQSDMHDEIVDALEAKDRQSARRALRRHWMGNLELVLATAKERFG